MTVSTTNNYVTATGNGSSTVFPYTFRMLDVSHMVVTVDNVVVTSGYSVSINTNGVGGNVTFSVAPANLAEIILERSVPITQGLDLEIEEQLPEGEIEDAYDKLTVICQQLQDQLDRAFTLSIVDSIGVSLQLPAPVAGYGLFWNDDGDALISSPGTPGPQGNPGSMTGPASATVGNLPTFANTAGSVLQDSGSSVASITTAYELLADPALNGFRLSLHATNPYPGDITGALTIYSIPYKGNKISLWDSAASKMKAVTSGIISETIAASTFYYRIGFIYEFLNAGVADLEINWWDTTQSTKAITLLTIANPCVITCTAHGWSVGDKIGIRKGTATGTIWTDAAMGLDGKEFYISATTTNTVTLEGCDASALALGTYTGATAYKIPATPATAAVQTEGVWFKSGNRTRRLVGLIKTNGSGTIDDSSVLRRNLSNVDNQLPCFVSAIENTASWSSPATSALGPRTSSLQLGAARVEFALALPQQVSFRNLDACTGGGGGQALSLDRVSSDTIGAYYTTAFGFANGGYNSGYVNQQTVVEELGVAAGGHFVQRLAYCDGSSFQGRAYASHAGANSFLQAFFMR